MFLNKQIYDVGFETYNPVLNLGGLYIIMAFIAAQMVALIIYKVSMVGLKVILRRLPSLGEGGDDEEAVSRKKTKTLVKPRKRRFTTKLQAPLSIILEENQMTTTREGPENKLSKSKSIKNMRKESFNLEEDQPYESMDRLISREVEGMKARQETAPTRKVCNNIFEDDID
jgi:hypothetical protein